MTPDFALTEPVCDRTAGVFRWIRSYRCGHQRTWTWAPGERRPEERAKRAPRRLCPSCRKAAARDVVATLNGWPVEVTLSAAHTGIVPGLPCAGEMPQLPPEMWLVAVRMGTAGEAIGAFECYALDERPRGYSSRSTPAGDWTTRTMIGRVRVAYDQVHATLALTSTSGPEGPQEEG